jgi:hypothetical protein
MSKARQIAIDGLGVGISSAGVSIGSSITTLNFVGTGNTFAVSDTTVDISISPDTTASPGNTINYPSGLPSPFVLNSVHVTESITFDNTNADTVPANIVTGESTVTVDDSVTITVEEGKTLVPDLYSIG